MSDPGAPDIGEPATSTAADGGEGPPLRRTDRGAVTTLTLARPGNRNALSAAMLDALAAALAQIAADQTVRVVVLAAEGPAFCAGHDLRELRALPDHEARARLFARCSDVMVAVAQLPQPVIAAVHGVATAAGCQLVATCDLAVAGASARFATPGVDIGLFCTTPMVAVSRAVLPKHAFELVLTGELVDADHAHRIGLVNRVVPDDELGAAVDALADMVASKPPAVMALGKEAYRRQRDLALVDAYGFAAEVMAANLGRAEAVEGIDAFLGKRPPRWPEP